MVYCCISGCNSRSIRGGGHRFFSIPALITNQCEKTKLLSSERRKLWVQRINRKNFTPDDPSRNRKVCDRHFISGVPSKLFDNDSPDWAPSVSLGYVIPNILVKKKGMTARKVKKIEKPPEPIIIKHEVLEIEDEESELEIEEQPMKEPEPQPKLAPATEPKLAPATQPKPAPEPMDVTNNIPVITLMLYQQPAIKSDASCMTEISGNLIDNLEKESKMTRDDNIALRTCIYDLKKALDSSVINELSLINNNDKVKFYTGLPTFQTLKSCYNLITCDKDWSLQHTLSPFQEFLVTLMRLRLNLYEQDLAYRFAVSQATISRIITRWLPLMAGKLKPLITWQDSDSLKSNVPQLYKDTFGENTCVIIDFFEISIGRPNQQTKRVRFVVAVMPQGSVSYVRRAEGETDEETIENSGVLDNLTEGDVAMVNSEENGGFVCARVVSDGDDKLQLSFDNVVAAKKLSKLKSYVENSMNYVRSKYHILEAVLPPEVLLLKKNETEPSIDNIVTICCALGNMCRSAMADLAVKSA